jgi:DNA-binding beta-propeller fold protein YncE
MRASAFRLAVVTALALLVFAGGALAAVGDLTPEGCIDDNDTGVEPCVAGVDGLSGTIRVAVSADGKSLYTTGFGDDAIVQFERTTNGALAPLGCIDDNDTGADDCAQSADGLDFPAGVAVSPDGTSVYVASTLDDAVVRFERNTTTGELTPKGCVQDNDTGTDSCAKTADGLNGAESVAVSADGTSVYVAADNDNAVARFMRDTTTGKLTPRGCVQDNDTGTDACARTADGLGGASSVAVSADGTSVYVASPDDRALARFKRDTLTGKLTPKGCFKDNISTETCAQTDNALNGARSVAVSADGTSVYVAAAFDDAVARFRRATTGRLSSKGCVEDNDTGTIGCAQTTDGLDFPAEVVVSADGESVYVAGEFDDSVVHLRRAATGALTPLGCVDDNDFGTDPMQGPDTCAQSTDALNSARGVGLSADGTSVYVASNEGIVRFTRETP